MKVILLILFSILFSANTILSQENDCSKIGATSINVTGPPGIVPLEDTMTFTANLIFADNAIKKDPNYKIEYEWDVSIGKIIDGQGTSQLKVFQSSDDAGRTLTATVTVKILPTKCTLTGSSTAETICFFGKISSRNIDVYSVIPPKIYKERLQPIYIELKYDLDAKVFIYETFSKSVKPNIIKKKLSNLFSYLTKDLGIEPQRIFLQFTVGDENLTELWITPEGADMPNNFVAERIIKGESFQQNIEKFFPKTSKKVNKK